MSTILNAQRRILGKLHMPMFVTFSLYAYIDLTLLERIENQLINEERNNVSML